MSKTIKIFTQLQKKLNKATVGMEAMFGPGFVSQHLPSTDDPQDDYIDVPDPADVNYPTFRNFMLPKGKKGGSNQLPFESALQEKKKEDDEEGEKDIKKDTEIDIDSDDAADMAAAAGEEETEEATGESDEEINADDAAAEADVEAGGDPAEAGMEPGMGGGDMGDMNAGMGEEEEPKTAGELGRIYELKKIYTRLTSIESYLSDESSEELLNIRLYVSQGIELFEILSSNFDSYKDKLDEIIITYYKFILEVYELVKNYYKTESSKNKK